MIVFQISPARMGSTWQFNTVRKILAEANTVFTSFYWDGPLDFSKISEKPSEVLVIKSHSIDPGIVLSLCELTHVKILFTLRNLNDSIESYLRVLPNVNLHDIEKSIEKSLHIINELMIAGVDFHLTRTDELNTDDSYASETTKIAKFLESDLDEKRIQNISWSLTKNNVRNTIRNLLGNSKDFYSIDFESLWHANHVNDDVKNEEKFIRNTNLKMDSLELLYEKTLSSAEFSQELIPREKSRHLLFHFLTQRDELTRQRDELTRQRDELTRQRDELLNSTIWKFTKPLRGLFHFVKR